MTKVKDNKKIINTEKKNKGQVTLEFALVLPFFILIVLICFQLGYTIYLKNIIEQSARESCRVISTTNSNQQGIEAIDRLCPRTLSEKILIEIHPEDSSNRKVGDILSVAISIKDTFLFKLVKDITGLEPEIKSESHMRMESN